MQYKFTTILVFVVFFQFPFFIMGQSSNNNEESNTKDSLWTNGGYVGFFFQQVSVDKWAGGGENAVSYGTELNLFANKKFRNYTWNNSLQAGYGLAKIGKSKSKKNNDVLILKSVYGRNLNNNNWQLSAGLDFRTQFDDGFNYGGGIYGTDVLISTFMAPGFLSPYLGFTYKSNDKFSATISPVMQKITFVLNEKLSNQGLFGVDKGSSYRSQIGWSINSSFEKQLLKNVDLKTNLLLFSAYDELAYVDINFDLFLNFKVNELITANFSAQAIYDHDIQINDGNKVGPRLQLRNVFNFGLTYNFGHQSQ